jgi:sec-independent protein translocase protein TatA
MGTFSIWHWLVVLAVVLILFGGGGKLSRLMGDFGKGLKSFKKSMKEEEVGGAEDAKVLETDTQVMAEETAEKKQASSS